MRPYPGAATRPAHIQRILSKLGVQSRAAAVSRAYRLGLVRAGVESHVFADEWPGGPAGTRW